MNILFISKEFLPQSNGTISCLINFLPYLSKEHRVVVCAGNETNHESDSEQARRLTIRRPKSLWDNFIIAKARTLIKIDNARISPRFKLLLIFLTKCCFYPFQAIAGRYGYLDYFAWSRNLLKFIENEEDLHKFSAVVTVSAPFCNIDAACEIKKKHPHLKLIFIQFDLYTYNPVLVLESKESPERQNRRLLEEQQWYSCADAVLMTGEMIEKNMSGSLRKWQDKVVRIGIPSLAIAPVDVPWEGFERNADQIHIVYTGLFYSGIRNPRFALQIFEKICFRDSRIVLHIYGSGCEDVIEEFAARMPSNLVLHGQVNSLVAAQARNNADLLLNISNSTTVQTPSKLFEYIGSGKPIINIYTQNEDICAKMLINYPYHISVAESNAGGKNPAEDVYTFIINSKGLRTEFSLIAELYSENSPANFSSIIINTILRD